MTPYRSLSGKQSGVTGYTIGINFIEVQFKGASTYKYTESLNDKATIDHMKGLALASSGLSTFIAQNKTTLRFN